MHDYHHDIDFIFLLTTGMYDFEPGYRFECANSSTKCTTKGFIHNMFLFIYIQPFCVYLHRSIKKPYTKFMCVFFQIFQQLRESELEKMIAYWIMK